MRREKMIAVFVGLDYHDSMVQVCVMNAQGEILLNHPYANDCAPWAWKILRWVSR